MSLTFFVFSKSVCSSLYMLSTLFLFLLPMCWTCVPFSVNFPISSSLFLGGLLLGSRIRLNCCFLWFIIFFLLRLGQSLWGSFASVNIFCMFLSTFMSGFCYSIFIVDCGMNNLFILLGHSNVEITIQILSLILSFIGVHCLATRSHNYILMFANVRFLF